MVRLALLAVLVSACLAAAPAAQAVDLPVDLQASAGAAVEQAQSLAGTAVTAANAAPPATPAVNATTATPSVDTAEVAQPAAAPPEYTTAAAVPVIADRPPHPDGDPPVRAARFKQGNGDTGSRAAQAGRRAALGRHSGDTTVPTPAVHRAPHATGAGPKRRPAAPDRAPPTSGGGAASAPAAGLALGGGLALLAAAVCLAGPRLRRRLLFEPAALRPVPFVSLLERPG
jgi:hypothetical protein